MEIDQHDKTSMIRRICRFPASVSKSASLQFGGRELLWGGIGLMILGFFILFLLPIGVVFILYSQKTRLEAGPSFMKSHKSKIVLVVIILGFLAWSPWITEDYAIDLVIDRLGGPEEPYNYLGSTIPVSDVPKNYLRVPFGALIYFPSEAMHIVTFWGGVI